MPTHISTSSSSAGRNYNSDRSISIPRLLLIALGISSVAFAVYIAESYPKLQVHSNPRKYQDELPYSLYALEPYISAETMDYHYNKHDYGYDLKLQQLVNNTDYASMSLMEILELNDTGATLPPGVYNNAGQLVNHNLFWKSMTPMADKQYPVALTPELKSQIEKDFKSFNAFGNEIITKATGLFGSGWLWVVYNTKLSKIEVITTPNGNYPAPVANYHPLFNLDIWEHAYYIDYRNRRDEYVRNFLSIINCEFASANYAQAVHK